MAYLPEDKRIRQLKSKYPILLHRLSGESQDAAKHIRWLSGPAKICRFADLYLMCMAGLKVPIHLLIAVGQPLLPNTHMVAYLYKKNNKRIKPSVHVFARGKKRKPPPDKTKGSGAETQCARSLSPPTLGGTSYTLDS